MLDMEISDSSGDKKHPPESTTRADFIGEHAEHVLLRPPIIETTGKIATGATTNKVQTQHKIHRTETLQHQPILSQWETHNGATILSQDHWDHRDKMSATTEMAPQGLVLKHEVAELLLD